MLLACHCRPRASLVLHHSSSNSNLVFTRARRKCFSTGVDNEEVFYIDVGDRANLFEANEVSLELVVFVARNFPQACQSLLGCLLFLAMLGILRGVYVSRHPHGFPILLQLRTWRKQLVYLVVSTLCHIVLLTCAFFFFFSHCVRFCSIRLMFLNVSGFTLDSFSKYSQRKDAPL